MYVRNWMGRVLSVVVPACLAVAPAWSGSHTWDTTEVYSKDATGLIEFIEVWEYANGPGEGGVPGHVVSSNTKTFTIPAPALAGNTAGKFLLFATAGFAALPGAPTPDYIIPNNFFSLTGADTVKYNGAQVPNPLSYTAGQLPLNGINSLNIPLTATVGPVSVKAATPTNYAGATFAPPGTAGLKVAKLPGFPDGSRLSLTWNSGVCLGAAKYQIAYGFGSQLPTTPGGMYGLQPSGASQCGITASPTTWAGIPNPGLDPSHFLWFTVLATNGTVREGSWGQDSVGNEPTGPGAGGSTGQCGITSKSLLNTCQ